MEYDGKVRVLNRSKGVVKERRRRKEIKEKAKES